MTDAPRRKVFLSSSNTAEKLFALAREFPQYEVTLKTYGWDLDVAIETDALGPTKETFDKMMQELGYAKRIYKAVSGRELRAD